MFAVILSFVALYLVAKQRERKRGYIHSSCSSARAAGWQDVGLCSWTVF